VLKAYCGFYRNGSGGGIWSMKTFDVFQLPDGNCRAIKYGFNWTSLFFAWIWCFFVAKLYGWGSVCLGAFIIGRIVGTAIIPSHNSSDFFMVILISGIFEFIFAIWFAANANNFRRNKYKKLEYPLVQRQVKAPNSREAIAKARKDGNQGEIGVQHKQESKNLAGSLRNLKSLKKRNILNDAEFKVAENRAEEIYEQKNAFNKQQIRLSQEEITKQKLQAKLDNNLADLASMYEEGIINFNTHVAAKRRLFRNKFWDNYWKKKK
jgi:hypothetical protein